MLAFKESDQHCERHYPARIVLVDPALTDLVGHHFEYSLSVAKAASALGIKPEILGYKKMSIPDTGNIPCHGVFRHDGWGSPLKVRSQPARRALVNFFFVIDLCKYLRSRKVQTGVRKTDSTFWFFHSPTEFNFLGSVLFAWIVDFLRFRDQTIGICLHLQPTFYGGALRWLAFRFCDRFRSKRNNEIRFFSDSEYVQRYFRLHTRVKIEMLPFPHLPEPDLRKSSNREIRIVTLGNPRIEKGFIECLQAVKFFGTDDNVQFVFQAYAPDEACARILSEFPAVRYPHLTLIQDPLGTNQYYDHLRSADLVLLPYLPTEYFARTSGPLSESIAVGRPVLVSGDTWLADQVRDLGTGLIIAVPTARSIAGGIREFIRRRGEFESSLEHASRIWRAKHSMNLFLSALFCEQPAPARPKRALVLAPAGQGSYPTWRSLIDARTCEGISASYDEVYVLEDSFRNEIHSGNITIVGLGCRSLINKYFHRMAMGLARLLCRKNGKHDLDEVRLYFKSWANFRLKRALARIAPDADAVFYLGPYWLPHKRMVERKYGVHGTLALSKPFGSRQFKRGTMVRAVLRAIERLSVPSRNEEGADLPRLLPTFRQYRIILEKQTSLAAHFMPEFDVDRFRKCIGAVTEGRLPVNLFKEGSARYREGLRPEQDLPRPIIALEKVIQVPSRNITVQSLSPFYKPARIDSSAPSVRADKRGSKFLRQSDEIKAIIEFMGIHLRRMDREDALAIWRYIDEFHVRVGDRYEETGDSLAVDDFVAPLKFALEAMEPRYCYQVCT